MDESAPVWQNIQEKNQLSHDEKFVGNGRSAPITFPGKPTDIPYDIALYHQMQQAADTIPNFERDLHLNDTSWSQLPLLGGLVQKLRRGLHSIALFYTNRALQHQQQVNKQLWESVGRLTAVTQTQQRTIQALQAQLAAHTQANSE